jgi:hypothetical protein
MATTNVMTGAEFTATTAALLDDLAGGTVRRLAGLTRQVPTGEAAFPALNAVLARVDPANDYSNPFEAVRLWRTAVGLGERAEDAVGGLLGALLAATDAALDAALNDPVNPWVRPKDFGETMTFSGALHAGMRAGVVGTLREGHPARAVEPLEVPYGARTVAVILLGNPANRRIRLSRVRQWTGEVNEYVRVERAGRERAERLQREERERALRNSPEGRVKALEQELERLRVGTVSGAGSSAP